MKFFIAYAVSTNFGAQPAEPMKEMLIAIFSGWLQSRIVEKANKVQREGECKNSNKVW